MRPDVNDGWMFSRYLSSLLEIPFRRPVHAHPRQAIGRTCRADAEIDREPRFIGFIRSNAVEATRMHERERPRTRFDEPFARDRILWAAAWDFALSMGTGHED